MRDFRPCAILFPFCVKLSERERRGMIACLPVGIEATAAADDVRRAAFTL